MAVFAPMPSARTATAVSVNAGVRESDTAADRRFLPTMRASNSNRCA
jgi:hypothetical protein